MANRYPDSLRNATTGRSIDFTLRGEIDLFRDDPGSYLINGIASGGTIVSGSSEIVGLILLSAEARRMQLGLTNFTGSILLTSNGISVAGGSGASLTGIITTNQSGILLASGIANNMTGIITLSPGGNSIVFGIANNLTGIIITDQSGTRIQHGDVSIPGIIIMNQSGMLIASGVASPILVLVVDATGDVYWLETACPLPIIAADFTLNHYFCLRRQFTNADKTHLPEIAPFFLAHHNINLREQDNPLSGSLD